MFFRVRVVGITWWNQFATILVVDLNPVKWAARSTFATQILQPPAGEGERGRVILGASMPS